MSDPRDDRPDRRRDEGGTSADDRDGDGTEPDDERTSADGRDGERTTERSTRDRTPADERPPGTGTDGDDRASEGDGFNGFDDRDHRGRGSTSNPSPPPDRRGSDSSSRNSTVQYVFDVASSILVVVAIGGLLFATSGIWPPLVAIESGSMEPHIQKGDLVFVMEEERFPGAGAHDDSGVVSARVGETTGYRSFGEYGDVIVYQPNGDDSETPIIHRAMFWVEAGENWHDRADSKGLDVADDCDDLNNCPAPHAGFITKGDNTATNDRYDQAMGISSPVRPSWIIGTAETRVPLLGEVRLLSGRASSDATDGTLVVGNNSTAVGE